MGNELYRPSLVITLNESYVPFNENYVYGPSEFRKPFLRIYIHELLHFWQYLSQGYLTKLALNEWKNLLNYEKSGDPTPPNDLIEQNEEFLKVNDITGFSIKELHEALCRFWDIHILGPVNMLEHHENLPWYQNKFDGNLIKRDIERMRRIVGGVEQYSSESFDMLMQVEDQYAGPYRWILEKYHTTTCVIFFPLIGYFAMQSNYPVEFFELAFDQLKYMLPKKMNLKNVNIHNAWREFFPKIKYVCHVYNKSFSGCPLEPGWVIIKRSFGADHPIFAHYLALIERLQKKKIYKLGWDEYNVSKELEFWFATPGDPISRLILGLNFLPPTTLFHDGEWISDIQEVVKARGDGIAKVQDPFKLAEIAKDITERFRKMKKEQLMKK
ncbi:MAG: hypothetical protein JSV09_06110 [Thermoplasmata archaeon]|nr:MAG: hypothetical protein JSV09_06110 [Thermoplasmata archaeon]